jgi:hypothetical protein
MPVYSNAEYLIRANLEEVAKGNRVRPVDIGEFTKEQFDYINKLRQSYGVPLLGSPVIVFFGAHLYKSRSGKDGYTIDDMVAQIMSALAPTSMVLAAPKMTAIRSTVLREDGYGNQVLDEAVFELTQRKPKAELFSVVPKGDKIRPNAK